MNKQKTKSNLLSVGKNIEKSKVNVGSNNVINETNIQIDAINHYHDDEDETNYSSQDEISREIRETVLISILTGFFLTLAWAYARKFTDLIPYPSGILIAVLLSIFRINKLGLWHSFVVGSTIGGVFTVTAIIERQYTAMDFIVSEAFILALLFHGLLGVLFGAIIGIVISLIRPLGV
jgi:hypothetical protein